MKNTKLLMFFLPFVVCVPLGFICGILTDDIWGWAKIFYMLAGAPIHVGLALCLLLNMDEDDAMKFGIGLYLGTWVGGSFIHKYFESSETSYVVSFIVSSLICYIFWIKAKKE